MRCRTDENARHDVPRSSYINRYGQGTMRAGWLRLICKTKSDSALEQGTAAHASQRLIICVCEDHRLLYRTLATSTAVTSMARL
jgi:hypothetical protein